MFRFQEPRISDLISLLQEINLCVKEDQIAIFPKEKEKLTTKLDQIIAATSHQQQFHAQDFDQSLQLLEHLKRVVNVDRYFHFSDSIDRAIATIKALQEGQPKHHCTLALSEYLTTHSIISSPQELYSGNRASITSAYKAGFLTLTEAIDAYRAMVMCSQKIQFGQLTRPLS